MHCNREIAQGRARKGSGSRDLNFYGARVESLITSCSGIRENAGSLSLEGSDDADNWGLIMRRSPEAPLQKIIETKGGTH